MAEIHRTPVSGSESTNGKTGRDPSDVNADLANIKMTEGLVGKLGTPSIVSKAFVIRYGIFAGLNHRDKVVDDKETVIDPGNETGYDASMRLAVYEKVGRESVNINGLYFEKFWAYLMKPKYTIMGIPGGQDAFNEEKTSIFDGIRAKLFPEKSGAANGNQ
jgi:hypothetical protein